MATVSRRESGSLLTTKSSPFIVIIIIIIIIKNSQHFSNGWLKRAGWKAVIYSQFKMAFSRRKEERTGWMAKGVNTQKKWLLELVHNKINQYNSECLSARENIDRMDIHTLTSEMARLCRQVHCRNGEAGVVVVVVVVVIVGVSSSKRRRRREPAEVWGVRSLLHYIEDC